MKNENVIVLYILGCMAQCLIGSHWYFTPYVLLSLLPGLIMCLPLSTGVIPAMLTAFVSGLAVDFFTDGMLGLSSCALIAVALIRLPIYRFFGGEELFSRKDGSPTSHLSPWIVLLAILIASIVYFAIYVWADGAGMRPIGFNIARAAASSAASAALCTILSRFIFVRKDQRWS